MRFSCTSRTSDDEIGETDIDVPRAHRFTEAESNMQDLIAEYQQYEQAGVDDEEYAEEGYAEEQYAHDGQEVRSLLLREIWTVPF